MKIQEQFILTTLLLIFFTSCEKVPTANFSTDVELSIYEPVEFTSSSEWADSYLWDFDDGSTVAIQNPSHQYALAGDYTVNLTVSNSDGSHSTSKEIAVRAIPQGEYYFLLITFKKAVNTGTLILQGTYNTAGIGVGINTTTAQPVPVSLSANFSVKNYDLTFEIEQINAGGAVGVPTSFVFDSRKMSAVGAGDLYVLSNDDFSFQLKKIK